MIDTSPDYDDFKAVEEEEEEKDCGYYCGNSGYYDYYGGSASPNRDDKGTGTSWEPELCLDQETEVVMHTCGHKGSDVSTMISTTLEHCPMIHDGMPHINQGSRHGQSRPSGDRDGGMCQNVKKFIS